MEETSTWCGQGETSHVSSVFLFSCCSSLCSIGCCVARLRLRLSIARPALGGALGEARQWLRT